MLDFDVAVAIGVGLCATTDDPGVVLATHGLNARLGVATEIARRHPAFGGVVRRMEQTNAERNGELVGEGLVEERALVQGFADDAELVNDVDYMALLAGMTAFMERFSEPQRNSARVALRLMERHPDVPTSAGSMALAIMACWFADFRGYRNALQST